MTLFHGMHTCLFLFEVSHIPACVTDKFLIVYFYNTCGYGIYEMSVMRDEKQGKIFFEQDLF